MLQGSSLTSVLIVLAFWLALTYPSLKINLKRPKDEDAVHDNRVIAPRNFRDYLYLFIAINGFLLSVLIFPKSYEHLENVDLGAVSFILFLLFLLVKKRIRSE